MTIDIKEGVYRGQRCFLIGTGPSLTPHQMRLVKPYVTIAGGSLPLWAELPYHPTVYCASEEVTFADVHRIVEEWTDSELFASFPMPREHYPTIESPHTRYGIKYPPVTPSPRWHVTTHSHGEEMSEVGCRVQIGEGKATFCFDCSGFMLPLQLALWLGFSEIYLLGFDFTNGSYVYSNGSFNRRMDYGRLGRSIDNILRTCQARGVKIANCSPGAIVTGALPQANLYDVLGLAPGEFSKEVVAGFLDGLKAGTGELTIIQWGGIQLRGFLDNWRAQIQFCAPSGEVLDRWMEDWRPDLVDCLWNWLMENETFKLYKREVVKV